MFRASFRFLVTFTPVYMPALSPSMETGTIVEWKKKVGDLVKENDVFCTIQTDKAVVDYTNTFDPGYLANIFVQNGGVSDVAKTIAVMVDEAEDVAKAGEYVPEGGAAAAEPAPAAAAPAAAAPAAASAAPPAASAPASGTTSEAPDGVNVADVFMPALSPSMETGTIVEWKKKVGDLVKENDVFCTIQTDKAVVDYTNTFDPGYLAKIYSENGSVVEVAKTIAVMVDKAEDIPKMSNYVPEGAAAGSAAPAAPAAAPAAAAPSAPAPKAASSGAGQKRYGSSLDEAIAASGPSIIRIANSMDRKLLENVQPSGKGGRFLKGDLVSLPGFNYEEAKAHGSHGSAGASSAASKPAKAAPKAPTAPQNDPLAVVLTAQGVKNFAVSDTEVLRRLLGTAKPKAAPKKVFGASA